MWISLLLSLALTALSTYFQDLLPASALVWKILEILVSLGVITILFALIFKILPDAPIKWKDVWIGSFVTAVLFTLGKLLLGIYITKAHIGSIYGAAGSIIVILVWTYYSTQIFFLGAEFTKIYSRNSSLES